MKVTSDSGCSIPIKMLTVPKSVPTRKFGLSRNRKYFSCFLSNFQEFECLRTFVLQCSPVFCRKPAFFRYGINNNKLICEKQKNHDLPHLFKMSLKRRSVVKDSFDRFAAAIFFGRNCTLRNNRPPPSPSPGSLKWNKT